MRASLCLKFRLMITKFDGLKQCIKSTCSLQASEKGLPSTEAEQREKQYGPNSLPDKQVHPIVQFFSTMCDPLSAAMLVAAIISIVFLDFLDFGAIILLLFTNASIRLVTISHYQVAVLVQRQLLPLDLSYHFLCPQYVQYIQRPLNYSHCRSWYQQAIKMTVRN